MIRLFLLSMCFSCSVWLAAQPSNPIDSIWRHITMEDVVVTAQYAPSHPSQAVHQVRVIEALDIQQQGLNNLAEVLTNQLNLRVSSDPFLGNGLRI
jgi:outer membrane receptor for ferrienterochelin and colicins